MPLLGFVRTAIARIGPVRVLPRLGSPVLSNLSAVLYEEECARWAIALFAQAVCFCLLGDGAMQAFLVWSRPYSYRSSDGGVARVRR